MRRVERGQPPTWISQTLFESARRRFVRFHSEGGTRKVQTHLPLEAVMGQFYSRAAGYAHELFLGKCAYSEAPVEPRLHLHRPESDAYDDDLGPSPEHYWWTAAWYGNWYVVSEEVAARKRISFPILGPRAKIPAPGRVSAHSVPARFLDHGVLLDPCDSYPELHLRFDREGYVHAWGEEGSTWLGPDGDRGRRTIDILGLNSDTLVKSRRDALQPALGWAGDGALPLRLLEPSIPHVGAVRQVLADFLLLSSDPTLDDTYHALLPEMVPLIASRPGQYPAAVVQKVRDLVEPGSPHARALGGARRPTPAAPQARKAPTTTRDPGAARTAKDTVRIPRTSALEHVEIVNFQAIERAEINISASTSLDSTEEIRTASPRSSVLVLRRPWRVLLGENGSGKSSTLRAIAMALSTTERPRLMRQCHLRWEDLLRRGTDEGYVKLVFTQGETIHLEFTRNRGRFVGNPPAMDAFVRGFGATRLLSDATTQTEHIRLGNLFRPQVPVINAEKWLVGLGDSDRNVVSIAIARLLDRYQEVSGSNRTRQPFIVREGSSVLIGGEPIKTMSDGYRAVIAMACDLMAGAGIGLSDMANATGIVLIDELGAHLHPRWKMQITKTLRRVFPSMQFIVTTHEPLCLRGLGANEVIAVRPSDPRQRPGWKAVLELIPESPDRYRVDQLLMSSFFGLDSTIDPDVKRDFDQYYALIRMKNPSQADVKMRERLRAQVSRHGVLGYTARDQMVYEIIDKYLATKDDGEERSPEQRKEDRQMVYEQVTDIWRTVERRHQATPGGAP